MVVDIFSELPSFIADNEEVQLGLALVEVFEQQEQMDQLERVVFSQEADEDILVFKDVKGDLIHQIEQCYLVGGSPFASGLCGFLYCNQLSNGRRIVLEHVKHSKMRKNEAI